jgi:hypothetical protein
MLSGYAIPQRGRVRAPSRWVRSALVHPANVWLAEAMTGQPGTVAPKTGSQFPYRLSHTSRGPISPRGADHVPCLADTERRGPTAPNLAQRLDLLATRLPAGGCRGHALRMVLLAAPNQFRRKDVRFPKAKPDRLTDTQQP